MKEFGNKLHGVIIQVNEDKLTIDYINQIRNYLNAREKKLRQK